MHDDRKCVFSYSNFVVFPAWRDLASTLDCTRGRFYIIRNILFYPPVRQRWWRRPILGCCNVLINLALAGRRSRGTYAYNNTNFGQPAIEGWKGWRLLAAYTKVMVENRERLREWERGMYRYVERVRRRGTRCRRSQLLYHDVGRRGGRVRFRDVTRATTVAVGGKSRRFLSKSPSSSSSSSSIYASRTPAVYIYTRWLLCIRI